MPFVPTQRARLMKLHPQMLELKTRDLPTIGWMLFCLMKTFNPVIKSLLVFITDLTDLHRFFIFFAFAWGQKERSKENQTKKQAKYIKKKHLYTFLCSRQCVVRYTPAPTQYTVVYWFWCVYVCVHSQDHLVREEVAALDQLVVLVTLVVPADRVFPDQ